MEDEDSLRGRKLLVVSAGSNKKENLFHELNKLGIQIILLDKTLKPWAPKYLFDFIEANTDSLEDSIQALKKYQNSGKNFEGAITFWEESVPLTAKICDEFGFVGNHFEDVLKIKNKSEFRKWCQKFGLVSIKSVYVKAKDDLNNVRELNFPIVLKPVYGSSSEYVVKINQESELEREYEKIMAGITKTDFAYLGTDLTAEEYIGGDEIDVDIMLQNGEFKHFTICDNHPTVEPFFIETGFTYPSQLSEEIKDKIFNFTKNTLNKFNIKNSCVHFEAKIFNGEVYPIEINLRLGGDGLEKQIMATWGINIVEQIARLALGLELTNNVGKDPIGAVYGKYLLPNKTGKIKEINIDPDLNKLNYLHDFFCDRKIGEFLRTPPLGYDYIGWLSAKGSNLAEAKSNFHNLESKVDIVID